MINDHEPFSAGVAGCCQARKAAGQAAQRAKAEAEKEQQEVGRVGWVQIQLQNLHVGIYKKTRPFEHIFGGDRILRA